MFNKLRKKYEDRLVLLGKLELAAKIGSFVAATAVFAGICYGLFKAVSAVINEYSWQKEKREIMESLKGYERSEYREPVSGDTVHTETAE